MITTDCAVAWFVLKLLALGYYPFAAAIVVITLIIFASSRLLPGPPPVETPPSVESLVAEAEAEQAALEGKELRTYTVRAGDTLMSIAIRYQLGVSELAAANGLSWNSWVYIGQRLVIPSAAAAPAPTPPPPAGNPPASTGKTYVVQAGNTLFSIARWHGTTVEALRAANGLYSNIIYVGQLLQIPDGSTPSLPAPAQPTAQPSHGAGGEKWIDVNLSAQRITAYEGQTPVYSALVSTGLWGTPTVVGTYAIYVKYVSTPMSGPGYYLPNVPHTMYFYRGYGIHGAYWHNNFGTPMSHGCVNLSLPDAEWFYNWAPVGTKVATHY